MEVIGPNPLELPKRTCRAREVFQGVLDRVGRLRPAPGWAVFPVPIGEKRCGPGKGVRLEELGLRNNVLEVALPFRWSVLTLLPSMVLWARLGG